MNFDGEVVNNSHLTSLYYSNHHDTFGRSRHTHTRNLASVAFSIAWRSIPNLPYGRFWSKVGFKICYLKIKKFRLSATKTKT